MLLAALHESQRTHRFSVWSEAFATAALLAGSRSVIAYLDSHHLSGLAITGDGDVLRTGDLSDLELSLAGGR